MIVKFFRELEEYTKEQVLDRLVVQDAPKQTEEDIKKEKEARWENIKKTLSDAQVLSEIPPNSKQDNEFHYKFTYVGIFETSDYLGYCFPKFVELDEDKNSESECMDLMKMMIRVIDHYDDERGKDLLLSVGGGEDAYSRLRLELFLYRDYLENGPYTNFTDFLEDNGEGEIDWDATINGTASIIKRHIPHYVTLKTWASQVEVDYFNRLHRCIVAECSRDFEQNHLQEFLNLFSIDDSEDEFEAFGDKDYILNRLNAEIASQFVTRKQDVLKAMRAYVERKNFQTISDSVFLVGNRNFNNIWEKACASLFVNLFPFEPGSKEDDLFHSKWYIYKDGKSEEAYEPISSTGELKPDILAEYAIPDSKTKLFGILDAKNYMISFDENAEKKLVNYPGIQDITKQFAYEKVLLGYLAAGEIKREHVLNMLLFPYTAPKPSSDPYDLQVNVFGRVEMPSLTGWPSELDPAGQLARFSLVNIDLVYLDYRGVFNCYLDGVNKQEMLKEVYDSVKNFKK